MPKPTDFIDQLVSYQVMQLNSKLNAQARAILVRYSDLSLAEWRVIRMLGLDHSITGKQIRDIIALDKGQFSKTVSSLVAKGLIKSNINSEDRRRLELCLTTKGQNLHNKIAPDIGKRNAFLLDQLTASEQRSFFAALKKLGAVANEISFLDQ